MAVGEKRLIRPELMRPAPLLKKSASLRPKRDLPFLASLSVQANHLALGIAGAKLGDLRHPGAGIVHQRKQNPIALAAPGCVVAGGEDGGDLLAGHEADDRLGAVLEGDREEALTDSNVIGSGDRQNETHEAPDGSQPCVAGSNGVVALGFQMIEKSEHRFGRQHGEGKLINGAVMVVGEILQQQPEGIAVSGDGLRADIALGDQVVGEIPLDQGREWDRSHGCGGVERGNNG
jgi:hypothetical protein